MGPKKHPRCEAAPTLLGASSGDHRRHLCSDLVGMIAGYFFPLAHCQIPLMLVCHEWYEGVMQQDGMKPKPTICWPYNALRFRNSVRLRLSNRGDDTDLLALVRELPNVQEVALINNQKLSDAGFECFRELTKLRVVDLFGIPINSVGFGNICQAPQLTHLMVHHHLEDSGLEVIAKCKTITHLRIDHSRVTDLGFTLNIPKMEKLEFLSFTNSRRVSTALMRLGELQNLKALDLSGCEGVTDSVLFTISDKLQNLTELNLDLCTNVTDAGFALLATFTKLTRLSLMRAAISREVLCNAIAKMEDLSHLLVNYCACVNNHTMSGIAKAVPRLTHLSIAACDNLRNDSLQFLDGLKHTLVSLDISRNNTIDTSGIAHVAPILYKLTHLSISGCRLVEKSSTLTLIGQLEHLTHLRLSQAFFSSKELKDKLPKRVTLVPTTL